jgi:penicillin-binding protein 1B
MKLPSLSWTRRYLNFNFKSHGKTVRLVVLFLLLGLSGYVFYLDVTIREAFDGRKFALPARVYGRALEVYPGLKLTPAQFVEELQALGYHETPEPNEAATYKYTLKGIEFTTKDFVFGDGPQAAQSLRIEFADGKVTLLQERGNNDRDLPLLRTEPPLIGGIYPGHNEDRTLLKLNQIPKPLIDALIATEDRKYYSH